MLRLNPSALFVVLCLLATGCAHHHHHHKPDGRLGLADLPKNVQDSFNHDHPDVHVKSVERDTQGDVTHYQIKYEDQGLLQTTMYDQDGKEMHPATLP